MSNPSPSPKPKWSSRMGGAIRRTSTLLTIARPTTPSGNASDRDSDTASLRRSTSRSSLSSPPAPAVPAHVVSPSPIAESPVREAAALQQETVGPSPLAQKTSETEADKPAEAIVASPEPIETAPTAAAEEATSPVGYIPPPVVDSSVGNPGAFTDEPEELPQAEVVADPYAATSTGPPAPSVEEPEAKVEQPAQEVEAQAEAEAPKPALEAPAMEQSASYFDKPMAESMKSSESLIHHAPEFAEVVEANTTIPPAAQEEHQHQEPDYTRGEAASYYQGDPPMPIAEPHRIAESDSDSDYQEERSHPIHEAKVQPAQPVYAPAPAPAFSTAVMPSSDLPSYSGHEVWGGHDLDHKQPHNVWAAAPVLMHDEPQEIDRKYDGTLPIPIPAAAGTSGGDGNGHASYHSQTSNMRMPNPHPEANDDPFADPRVPIVVTHTAEPQIHYPEVSQRHQQAPVETHEDSRATILMPLPAFGEVVGQRSIHHTASNQSLAGSKIADERIPLLSRPLEGNRYLGTHDHQTRPHSRSGNAIASPLVGSSFGSGNGYGSTQPRLLDLGWVEYILPDGTVYYYHMTQKLATDLNLRSDRILTAVNLWMDGKEGDSIGVDLEGWLREVDGKGKKKSSKSMWGKKTKEEPPVVLERYWVDHHRRSVVKEDLEERRFVGYGRNHAYSNGNGHSGSHSGKGKKQASVKLEEDQLDLEYRYWSYMEAHPAHLPVSQSAKADALDVLNWAWTDRLLPSHRAIPAPFTQEECKELRPLLQSFDRENEHGDRGIQTRIIARVLLRVAQWRQAYFRPNKALPKDVDSNTAGLPTQPRPFRRAVFDILISCLCLGIPYLFLERARLGGSRTDEESGALRGASPMLIIGACTCLVAAIVLSASVTFLSLPGLDGVARTAGMVAVLFAAFAMAAVGVAVLRHKADLERPIPRVGVEGLMVVSRRTIAFSLPLVFLAYSIIGFITAITLYSFRGVSLDDPTLPKTLFEDYTKWTVVGVLGALVGMMTMSLLILRR